MTWKVFYAFIGALTIVDSYLLSKPNLLGKMGLIIYKFHYLRTFPRALLTVSIVVAIAIVLAGLVRLSTLKKIIRMRTGRIMMIFLMLVCGGILLKTGLNFSTWATGHTGFRFKYGAYLLPSMLIVIFGYALVNLPKGRPK